MKKKMERLTSRKKSLYLQRGGYCPYCRSESVTGESVDIDSPSATQEVSCQNCGRTWRDIYRLADLEEIKT